METSDRESILLEIDATEKQITNLQQQQNAAEKTLQSLRERLAEHNGENVDHTAPATPVPTLRKLTREERISLFMHLFRGRER